MPTEKERLEIFKIHLTKKKRPLEDFDLERLARESKGFSGAEVEQVVIAALYDAFFEDDPLTTERLLASIKEIIPLSLTMKEKIDDLRDWAQTRARSASGVPIGHADAEGHPEPTDGAVPAGFRNLELGD